MEDLKLIQVLRFFLENPYEEVYLRELAKKMKISPYATKKYADLLVKENIIREEKKANLRYFKSNTTNLFYKYLKIAFAMQLIHKSMVVEYLKKNIANVSAIILFGSVAKGENTKESDLDIVIIGKEKSINLTNVEDRIGTTINTHIFSWSEWNKKAKNDKAFYHEVVNYGIPLFGELPLVQ